MAEEVLNRNIQKLLTYKQCSPNYYSRQASPPCHLLFADDLLIFAKATLKGARALKKISFPDTPIPQALLERGPQQSEMQSSFGPCSYRSKESKISLIFRLLHSPKSFLGSLFFRDNQRKIILVTLLKPSTKD